MRLNLFPLCLLVALVFVAAAPTASAQWVDVGNGLAGTSAVPPVLAGLGPLIPTAGTKVSLAGGLPSTTGFLIVGFTNLSAPFKGGVLVPHPDVLLPMSIDAAGNWQFIFSWPTDIPAGTVFYWQTWLHDAGGPHGFAASNGLQSTAN